MAHSDDESFRVKPGAPKSRARSQKQRFVSQLLKQMSKAGGTRSGKNFGTRTSSFGRGRVAASMAGRGLGMNAQRVVIKSRFVVLRRAGKNSVAVHLRYIERDGVTRDGSKGQAYGANSDKVDLKEFKERGKGDRHQFRFIVSPENGAELGDLQAFTRQLMHRVSVDLETPLDWVAVDHWDTATPHTHVVLNGRIGGNADLLIAPEYMAHGMRMLACEIATDLLGPRTEAEIRQSLLREVDQHRLTGLDRSLARQAHEGVVDLESIPAGQLQNMLRARVQRLERMGLAERLQPNKWKIEPTMVATLDAMGEREDAFEIAQRAMKGLPREYVLHDPLTTPLIGRVAGKGLIDELSERGYLVVDGTDGHAHFLKLPSGSDLTEIPLNGIVEIKPPDAGTMVDRGIADVARNGMYRTVEHLARLRSAGESSPEHSLEVHVRRLERLRRAGLVDRISEGIWRVPPDLVHQASQYDARSGSGPVVRLQAHLPLSKQVRAVGATWLDRQLVGGGDWVTAKGFGTEVKEAMQGRVEFLAELGLAERQGRRVVLSRNLLTTLREQEIASVGKALQGETGQAYLAIKDGQQVSGVYRRSIQLVSGRFAVLDQEMGFALVPWKPLLESRLGRTLTATVRGGSASWEVGRQRAPER